MNQVSETSAVGLKSDLFERNRKIHMPGEAGIWIFILGDMTLYCGLFISFMVDRTKDVELFNHCSSTLHPNIGGINMLLLLVSSLAVALGVRAVREKITEKRAPMLFTLAFLCGIGFVVNKYFEYSGLAGVGITPFTNPFYIWYYILTLLHLTHLLAGMGVLIFLFNVGRKCRHDEIDVRGLESGACFWHTVDLLWVVLFPLLYLMR